MRQIIILFAFTLFIGNNTYSQNGGMSFTDAPWSQVLEEAQKENKIIFVDAYTTWCGPCKKMNREVFPQTSVGDFYNANFINTKLDMEKGDGLQFAKQYNVRAYPTFLFLDGGGNIVHRTVGYHDPDGFLELGNAAMDPTRQLSSMKTRFVKGDRNPEFLYNYAMTSYDAMDGSHTEVAEAYMNTQDNWMTEGNMSFIFKMADDPDSKLFNFLIENRALFEKQFGERAIMGKIQFLINSVLSVSEGGAVLNQAKKIYTKVYPEKAELMYSQFAMSYYRQKEDADNFAKTALAHYSKFEARDWNELNDVAWTFFEEVDNKKQLKKAVKWARQSIEMDDNYYNNDTLAALYFKIGKKGKAKKTALKAIERAKEAGEDYSLTEELLNQIKGK